MIPNALEEDPASEKGNLESMDIEIRAIEVPRVCPDPIRNKGRKETVKVE